MTNNEIPKDKYLERWTEYGLRQLYGFMDSFQPTFQTRESSDPIILAQEFQKTIDAERDAYFRQIMGTDGEKTLNQLAPNQISYRHLAIITSRLIVLSDQDGEVHIDDYAMNVLVTGMFDRFAFEPEAKETHAEKDRIAVKMVKPEFLVPKSKKVALELFDAEKSLIPISSDSELTIPVDAVQGRVYDPEVLFS